MTLLSGWALAGLVLIAPLVLAHLRRGRPQMQDVASLLIWQELADEAASDRRRPRMPNLPLLLLLQALAVVLLVFALARPEGAGPALGRSADRVLVLDDSVWMSVPGRLAEAEHGLASYARAAPAGTSFEVVVAAASPYVLYRGDGEGAARALGLVRPTSAPAGLGGALTLAGGALALGGQIAVARAPEDRLPQVLAAHGAMRVQVAGSAGANQALVGGSARCGIAGADGCEVLVLVRNTAPRAVRDEYAVEGAARATLTGSVEVPRGGQGDIAVSARPGQQIHVRLLGADVLRPAASIWLSAPWGAGQPPATRVTLVGERSDALPVARALASVPGVSLRVRTPRDYRPAEALDSQLVVLDRSLPGGVLPQAPGVLLIAPPSLPGGHVGGVMGETELSGSDPASGLLEGVDLSALAVDGSAARMLTLPAGIRWVAWSPSGPLLASGVLGGRRLAVLSFDPSMSDLPQLAAFPELMANIVRSLSSWAPASAASDTVIGVDPLPGARTAVLSLDGRVVQRASVGKLTTALQLGPPGVYDVTETGPGQLRRARIDVNVADPERFQGPVDLRPAAAVSGGPPASLAPAALLAALAVIAVEAGYGSVLRRRTVPA